MKFKFNFNNLLLSLGLISFMAVIVATTPSWQPPVVDDSLVGDGTREDPIGTDVTSYEVIMSQSSTNAPTMTVIDNELSGAGTWAYTSAGIYTWTLPGDDFTANETFVDLTVGNATGLVGHGYSTNDSTLIVKIFDAAGAAVNLAGTAYLRVTVLKE